MNLSTPHEVIESKIPNKNIKYVNEIFCKNVKLGNITFEIEHFDKIIHVKKEFDSMWACMSKEIDCTVISNNLLQIANKEELKGNKKLSTFVNFRVKNSNE